LFRDVIGDFHHLSNARPRCAFFGRGGSGNVRRSRRDFGGSEGSIGRVASKNRMPPRRESNRGWGGGRQSVLVEASQGSRRVKPRGAARGQVATDFALDGTRCRALFGNGEGTGRGR
jgi:hypothetical protein